MVQQDSRGKAPAANDNQPAPPEGGTRDSERCGRRTRPDASPELRGWVGGYGDPATYRLRSRSGIARAGSLGSRG